MPARRTSRFQILAIFGIFFAVFCGLAAGAGPRRPKAAPGELIVRYHAPQSIPLDMQKVPDGKKKFPAGKAGRDAGAVPVSAGSRTALSFRSAEEVAEAPGRAASLKALDARFGLLGAKPVFDRVSPPSRRGLPSADGSSPFFPSAEELSSGAPYESALWVLRLNPETDLEAARKAYESDPHVRYAEPNWLGTLCYIPSDPLYPQTASDLALIGMEAAWAVQRGADVWPVVTVAVIDSGVERFHPDLAPALNLADSWNFVDGNQVIFDDLGHGTRVAGIIGAAANNGEGIAGIAFGCRILSLDVTNASGNVTTADVASAIHWAVARGAHVANMSLRFSGHSQTLENACNSAVAAGVLLVAAAGNENQGDLPVYPASFDSVIGVGAVADDGLSRAPFSNYNGLQKNLVELVAPGATIFSTIPGSQYNGTYGSGTSYAAPMVAGVAALLKARYPEQDGGAIRDHLRRTAVQSPGFQPASGQGYGLLSAQGALETAMVPQIVVKSVMVDDDPSYHPNNDGDGVLDKGESVKLILTLGSERGAAANLVGVLSVNPLSASASVIGSIAHNTVSFGSVGHGAAVSNTADPFTTITVSGSAAAQTVYFDLALTADGGYSQSLSFSLMIENEFSISGVRVNQTFSSATTYRVTSNLSLRGTTTIEPGTVFKVDPGVDIRVDSGGSLTAVGTAEAPIRFTAAKPFVASPSGGIGPLTEPVNFSAYQEVRYVSATTGSNVSTAGSESNPWRTIPYALGQITDASPGKRYALLVAEGVYTGTDDQVVTMKEHVDLYGGFRASDWFRDVAGNISVIDGQNERRGVLGANNARLDGFTVTKGKSSDGGGIYCSYSSPAITNCLIIGNSASAAGGGGIYCSDSSPAITNCLIVGNLARPSSGLGGSGGGIYCRYSSLAITNCLIFDNLANQRGGGIFCNASSPAITNSLIFDNSADSGGGLYGSGGGIYCQGSSPSITNCLIAGNLANGGGGGEMGPAAESIARAPLLRLQTV